MRRLTSVVAALTMVAVLSVAVSAGASQRPIIREDGNGVEPSNVNGPIEVFQGNGVIEPFEHGPILW